MTARMGEKARDVIWGLASSVLGEHVLYQYRIDFDPGGIRFDQSTFSSDTPLYADWDYPTTHSAGLTM